MKTLVASTLVAAMLLTLSPVPSPLSAISAAPVPCEAQASQMRCTPDGCFFPPQSPNPQPRTPDLAPIPASRGACPLAPTPAPERSVLVRTPRFPLAHASANVVRNGIERRQDRREARRAGRQARRAARQQARACRRGG